MTTADIQCQKCLLGTLISKQKNRQVFGLLLWGEGLWGGMVVVVMRLWKWHTLRNSDNNVVESEFDFSTQFL